MKYAYPACFYPEDDGRFSVVFVDFELAIFGTSLADAIHMAADAAAGRILSLLASGEKLPKPTDIKETKPDDPDGFASMVYIDMESQKASCDENPVENACHSFMAQQRRRKEEYQFFSDIGGSPHRKNRPMTQIFAENPHGALEHLCEELTV